MKYAVIAISGTQYKVEENKTITVDQLGLEEGKESSTDQVLLLVDGDKVTVGMPTVAKTSVDFKILKNYRGEKLDIFKYKSKSRYRRAAGHRSELCDIQITKING